MAEIKNADSGASQPIALLFLAGWVALVVVLGFFMLTGRAAATTSIHTALPDAAVITMVQQSRLAESIPNMREF